ncbi:MAG: 16S rRNA (cytosine(1402)-N(4))-methyltransferase RsmH [candidate division KSB1 bacterium]|nr:16S rRNA (cytosine(1402)-N(4))-methyltransferase RsmH [candidate division KSB1 bacterium]
MIPQEFHTPVLTEAVVAYLIGNPSGIYIDGTVGAGGHSRAILNRLTANGRVIGIDRDDRALEEAGRNLAHYGSQVMLCRGNFAELKGILDSLDIDLVDGILLDLGVSSHQIDTPERGFSYNADGPLDMRMSRDGSLTAAQLINQYSVAELEKIIREYGEERRARAIARAIARYRAQQSIATTRQLTRIIESSVPHSHRIKTLARVFQALRIAVNDELTHLSRFLTSSLSLVRSGGRIVIIAYHSLEDRLVKEFFSEQANPCICPADLPSCVCGKQPTIRLLTRKVVRPSTQEIALNPRSRSAKLRAAEKI